MLLNVANSVGMVSFAVSLSFFNSAIVNVNPDTPEFVVAS